MQTLFSSEVLEADYGGVPLGMEAFFSIPAAHPSRAQIPFEGSAGDAHHVRHANPLELLP